jgi:hypothetical protein
MSTQLSKQQLAAINEMSAEQRYDNFIEQAIVTKNIWGLFNNDGWVILSGYEDDEFLPVWPNAELAELWATASQNNSAPTAIPLDDWLGEWLPGMSNNGLLIAVSPNSEDDCITLGAEELLQDMQSI